MIGSSDEAHDQQRRVQPAPARAARAGARSSRRTRSPASSARLEEHEARRPHRGRAAEPRQDLLRDDRLDQEQQERAGEDREGGEEHRARRAAKAGATGVAAKTPHSTGAGSSAPTRATLGPRGTLQRRWAPAFAGATGNDAGPPRVRGATDHDAGPSPSRGRPATTLGPRFRGDDLLTCGQ